MCTKPGGMDQANRIKYINHIQLYNMRMCLHKILCCAMFLCRVSSRCARMAKRRLKDPCSKFLGLSPATSFAWDIRPGAPYRDAAIDAAANMLYELVGIVSPYIRPFSYRRFI